MVEVSQGGGEPGGISGDTLPRARLSLPRKACTTLGMAESVTWVVQVVTHGTIMHAAAPREPPAR